MADSGNLGEFDFGSETFTVTDCLQSASITENGNLITYNCGGSVKSLPGVASSQFTASVAIAKDDTAKLDALAANAIGTFAYRPFGPEAGSIEYTSTNGTSATLTSPGGPGTVVTLDVTIDLDDLIHGVVAA